MTTPLLATKLFAPPPSPRSVERQRLMQRLDAGLQGKLTLVCAPAGFGKSTLLGAWVQACEHPSAWLSLDEEERDPNRFVAYLTASLRSVAADLGEAALAQAQARPRPSPEAVLIHLINRLDKRRGRLVLVLDDYQLASNPKVDALLSFLIDHQAHHASRSLYPLHRRAAPELLKGNYGGMGRDRPERLLRCEPSQSFR
jgi:LuxR family maltose regulon positive regulatory protein